MSKAEKEDCVYWFELYEKIFNNNLELDQEALIRRLNVPEEIKDEGAAAVGHYLAELEKGALRLNEARIIILGDKGAGKTCVARRLENPAASMTTPEESTAGVDTSLWQVGEGEDRVNANIWDFAGHTVTHAVHRFFLSERCLYILVYDGRTEGGRDKITYWLDHMKNFGGNSEAFILINRKDKHRVNIPVNYLDEQYSIAGFYDFSVQDDKEKLEKFRADVADYIRDNPSWEKQEIPESYYQVKSDLENLFLKPGKGKSREHISRAAFNTIAQKHGVEDVEELLTNLHALGISLWYKDIRAFDSLVLNPEWISQGVYRIINWVSNKQKNGLTISEFKQVFSDSPERYPTGECHSFLFDLMKHYELAYETRGSKRLIIPHLLNEDRPKKLPVFEVGESLKLQYQAVQMLPPNTISRFIVRHHEQIRGREKVWRYGVVLEDGKGSLALVREEDRTISVSVKGHHKSIFLDELRTTLNDIFNDYKSKKPTLKYLINEFGQIQNPVSQMGQGPTEFYLPESRIINHVTRNRPYYDDVSDTEIDLKPVAELYRLANLHRGFINVSIDKRTTGMNIENLNNYSGNQQFADTIINYSTKLDESDRRFLELIHENTSSPEERQEMVRQLETIKSDDTSDEEKQESGGRLKKFIDAVTTESGKQLVREVLEHGGEWVSWLGM